MFCLTIHRNDKSNSLKRGSAHHTSLQTHILWQEQLTLRADETSKDIYERILALEMELLEAHLDDLLTGNYTLTPMAQEGNLNYKQDFDRLCEMNLAKTATYGEVIDYLRAMTFEPYNNAFFIDDEGKKVYVSITLKKEDEV